MDYTPEEMMIIAAARMLRDGEVVFVGIGWPNLACNLARRLHAPNLVLIYEAGVIGARPRRLPLSIGDPALVSGALAVLPMFDLFAFYLQRGRIDVGFLSGAQVDRFGNLNATVIGAYHRPQVRLPGSGGAAEIAAWAGRFYVITPHERRRFPEHCDFRTAPGFLEGWGSRQRAGLSGGGPAAVITDLGILTPDASGELVLTAIHPGILVETVQEQTGWPLRIAPDLTVTPPPAPEELAALRALRAQSRKGDG
ncbi:CoA-transferase subunit beta [Thermoflexus sp.]|uniref:CoA-transferase subunit beta n=1 Tax=Thermoflexus sp. TaxID=1969742 RepID=UPI0035E430F5